MSERFGSADGRRERNHFGPWATALDTEPGARLSTFWQRRMAMLGDLHRSTSRVTRRMRVGLAGMAMAALAAPLIYISRTPLTLADDPASATSPPKDVAVEFLPLPSIAEERILAELDKPTKMDFQDTPLCDAVDYLKDLHSIEIQLDTKAMEEAGQSADSSITRYLNGISLRSALRLLLGPTDLTYLIKDEVLLITTKDKADAELTTRVYPVGDLVEKEAYDSLIEAITTTVRPSSWDEVGGPGTLSSVKGSNSIVVSQTRDAHDEVLGLLRAVRKAKKMSAAKSK